MEAILYELNLIRIVLEGLLVVGVLYTALLLALTLGRGD